MNEREVQEVKRYLNVIKRATSLIEGILDNSDGGLMEMLAEPIPPKMSTDNIVFRTEPQTISPPRPEPLEPVIKPTENLDRQKHINELLAIDCWPEAVPQMLTKKEPSEKEKIKRANMVIDMMVDRKLNDLKFLDFGCGEGHITEQMTLRGVSKSIGYDIEKKDTWNNFKNAQFTDQFNDLTNGQLFDIIMLYDVLDHCENPELVMKQVKSLLSNNGVVYVRCHPWISTHGCHLHSLDPELNKAFFHLFITWEEIYELSKKEPMYTRKELNPIEAYHWWFKGFDIKRERKMTGNVSEFFHVPAFKKLLATEQGINPDSVDDLLKNMEIQFVDFLLAPKN